MKVEKDEWRIEAKMDEIWIDLVINKKNEFKEKGWMNRRTSIEYWFMMKFESMFRFEEIVFNQEFFKNFQLKNT